MAFNLPPPWDPGFALPSNVRDEGLERRGFVTKWMPRGTYDQPKVGTGGYAVPQYVMDEGYGQGTFTTKWAPRGRYDIPVPNWLDQRSKVLAQRKLRGGGGGTQITFDALSGTDLPKLYTDFGARAAKAVMRQILAVPPAVRKQTLKAILDRIDPSLWNRVAQIAAAIQKGGVSAGDALYPALAQAMSTGIAAEVIATGLRRSAPQSNTLLGLGCYRGSSALGATPSMATPSSVLQKITSVFTQGSCPPPPGYTWDTASGGYWRRLKVGETAKPGPAGASGCGTVTTNTGPQATEVGGGTKSGQVMELGPSASEIWFKIPIEDRGIKISTLAPDAFPGGVTQRPTQVPQSLIDAIAKRAQEVSTGPGGKMLDSFFDQIKLVDGAAYGYPGYKVLNVLGDGRFGVFSFQHPTINKRHSLRIKWIGTPALPQWHVYWVENEPSDFQKAMSFLGSLFARVVDVVKAAVDAVADLACKVASSGLGVAAGAGAAAAAGVPPEAGAAGASIAAAACASPPPAPTGPLVMPGGGSLLLPLAIAGGVVAVALALKKKKKKAP